MSPKRVSRRTALSAGGVLAGLGVVGASSLAFTSDDDQTPGADGFTAKTVPAGSDPLVLIDADSAGQNSTAKAVIGTSIDAGQFGDLSDALAGAFEDESESTADAADVGKLVLVGSDAAEDGGGAVVWADWTDDELLAVLESGADADTRTESYGGRTLYTAGATSAVGLGDTEFALGTTAVVRNIVDVWHGDAEPVSGETLNSFERTPRRALVRFSFENLLLSCDGTAVSQSDAYDAVTQVYGSVPATGDAVQIRLRVESNETASEVATAVRDDFGLTGGGGNDAGLAREVRDGVTVEYEHDFVTVEYNPETDENGDFASDVLETTVCLTGRSS